MKLAIVVLAIGWLLASGVPRLDAGVGFVQTAPSQQAQPPEATPAPATPTSPSTTAAKPCPAVSGAGSPSPSDCKPVHKRSGRKTSSPATTSGPTKKVVHNGSTGDLDVGISPGVSTQQA